MMFALGFIAGVLVCAIILIVALFFRKPLERIIEPVTKAIEVAGPRPRGFLIEPESDQEEAVRKHVQRNARLGRDTPISELIEESHEG